MVWKTGEQHGKSHLETFNNILYTKKNDKTLQLLDNKTLDLD